MKILLVFWLVLVNITLFGQEYFSTLIPFELGNPSISQLLYENEIYSIPVIFDGNTTLIKIQDNDFNYFTINDFTISRNGLCSYRDSEYYYYGKNRNKQKGLEIINTEKDNSSLITRNIITNGDFNFPTTASKLNDNLMFCAFTKDFNQSGVKLPEFLAFNLSNNEETRVEFNKDLTYTVPWVINSTFDNNIFISSGIQFPNTSKRYGQMIKMDNSGNIIWRKDGNEEFENGSIPAWAVELSDSSIVQSYFIDKRSDLEFIANEKFELPIRLKWFSKDGDHLDQKLIVTPKKQQINFNGLKKGNGAYFFAYGDLQDWSEFGLTNYFTHLTKFSNRGDTIWTRNYQHADYNKPSVFHEVKDIFEHENGDISILATVAPVGEKNEIWLYKVNSSGCYLNVDCEDMSSLVNNTTEHEKDHVNLFPNPASEWINIAINTSKMDKLEIQNQIGEKLISKDTNGATFNRIDIDDLVPGIYFMSIFFNDNQQVIKKFTKL